MDFSVQFSLKDSTNLGQTSQIPPRKKGDKHFSEINSEREAKSEETNAKSEEKIRLDIFLTLHNLTQSRNQAIELIKNGFVSIQGTIITKPSFLLSKMQDSTKIAILKKDIFVSRAGEKLDFFIKANNIRFDNLVALDIGSSKGGFTQVLLQNGVKSVVCVDVGSNQLDSTLRENPLVKVYENCDIKDFSVDFEFDFIVCDVSFVSLKAILPHIRRLCNDRAILLFKPQFEVGKATKRNKNGVVVDKMAITNSLESFKSLLKTHNFSILAMETSQIKGKAGNEEIFIYIKKQ